MKPHIGLLLLITLILFTESITCSPLTNTPLGIPPQDISYFKPEIIKCRDGSNKFTKSQLNDDFCDCLDGTDEPGTSACPGGKFYCQNVGHAPLLIFSSRVNDGICDCCDGSDEYNGRTNCSNTCWEAGKVARDKLKKKIATYKDGVTIRNREIEEAKLGIAKDEVELLKLKNEETILKKLVEQLKEHKEQIEKAEEKERLEKEKEEKKKSESEERSDEQIKSPTEKEHEESDEPTKSPIEDKHEEADNTIETSHDPPAEQEEKSGIQIKSPTEEEHEESDDTVGTSDDPSVEQHKDGSDSTEGLSKEELGRLVASRWTGETSEEKTKDIPGVKLDEHETSSDMNANEEDNDGYHSENDGETQKFDEHKYDEDEMDDEEVEDDFDNDDHGDSSGSYNPDSDDQDDFSDLDSSTTSTSSWLDKIQQTVRNILQSVNLFQTPIDKSDASRVRKEYDESSAKLSKIQSRISRLDEKLKQDFGMEKEFYSFYGRCFESKGNKYVYKVCPFKQASQVEGHSTTQLGRWDKFEDSYRAMVFSNGDKCWNGPDRSLKVKLRCGLTNEITDVDEPSRCEYIALLSTPALCLEGRLKELQQKLDLMNSEQPDSHDEL